MLYMWEVELRRIQTLPMNGKKQKQRVRLYWKLFFLPNSFFNLSEVRKSSENICFQFNKKRTSLLRKPLNMISKRKLKSSFLFNTSRFTSSFTEVEDTCSTYSSVLKHFNVLDERRVNREDTLYSNSSRYFTYCKSFGSSFTSSLKNNTSK